MQLHVRICRHLIVVGEDLRELVWAEWLWSPQTSRLRLRRKVQVPSWKLWLIHFTSLSSPWLQQYCPFHDLRHRQGWSPFEVMGVFLSVSGYSWCTPLSHPSSCMLVNRGPSQHSSKEEYKPWKWGATARYYAAASHIKTMLPTSNVPRSSRQSDHTKTSWPS